MCTSNSKSAWGTRLRTCNGPFLGAILGPRPVECSHHSIAAEVEETISEKDLKRFRDAFPELKEEELLGGCWAAAPAKKNVLFCFHPLQWTRPYSAHCVCVGMVVPEIDNFFRTTTMGGFDDFATKNCVPVFVWVVCVSVCVHIYLCVLCSEE